MKWPDVLVNIATVAAGGGVLKAAGALLRHRGELRQLDRQTDSVIVATAREQVESMRIDLVDAKTEIKQLKADHAAERADMQRQIELLGERVSTLSVDLAIARAEIARLHSQQPPAG